VNGDHIRFDHVDVTNRHAGICFILGGSGDGRADWTVIERSRIHDCGRLPATQHDHGVYVAVSSHARIVGNLIYDNADFGLHLYPDARSTTVVRNVIDGNGGGVLISGDDDRASRDNVIEHNVISNSLRRWNVESWWGGPVGSGNAVRENCLHATNPEHDSDGGVLHPTKGFTASRNVVADPRFVNRARKDFRLRGSSRCRAVLR
jgi:parallel beta-helix repeat protein